MSGILSAVSGVFSGVTPTPADLLVNYTSGSGAVTTTNIAAATLGAVAGSWTYLRGASSLAATTIMSESVTRFRPILVGGIGCSTFTRVIQFDLSGDDADWEGLSRALPAGHGKSTLSVLAKVEATGAHALDFADLNGDAGGSFAVTQANTGPGLNSHSTDGGTTRGRYATNPGTWLLINTRFNADDNLAETVILNNTTGEILLASECANTGTEVSDFHLQDYLTFNGGTLKLAAVAVDLSGAALLEGQPTPTPGSVTCGQTANDELTLTWASPCQIFKVERNAGAGWSTLNAAYDVVTNHTTGAFTLQYIDSTVTNAVTYQYRLTAIIAGQSSATASSNSVTVENSGGDIPAGTALFQNFESASKPPDWEDDGTGVSWGQTGVILDGTRSLAISSSGYAAKYAYNSTPFGPLASCSGFFDWEFSAVSTYNQPPFFRLYTAGFAVLATIKPKTNGDLVIAHGTVTATAAVGLTQNTHWRVFYEYVAGGGSDGVFRVYASATDVKPASPSGATGATITTGDATGSAGIVSFLCEEAATTYYIDRVRVD